MKHQRPALRVALLAIAAAVIGFAVIASFLGWRAHRYTTVRHQASAVASGSIVESDIGDSGDIRVRWADAAGSEHVQRFSIYNTDRYRRGTTFAVAYDLAHPTAPGFPGDPEETSAEDDLVVPIGIAGALTALLVLTWVLRGTLFRSTGRRPGLPMVAETMAGQRVDGGLLSPGNSAWVALADPTEPGTPTRWQRVMWHPVIDSTDGAVGVLVHGNERSRSRVVVQLPGDVRLVPIGRCRNRTPRRVHLDKRADVRTDLADSFILPAGTQAPPSHQWWRRGLVFSLVGVVIGVVMGFLIGGGGVAVLPFVAGASAFLVNSWALAGTDP